jgi:hypothetical protein
MTIGSKPQEAEAGEQTRKQTENDVVYFCWVSVKVCHNAMSFL